jgi:hypothetical protein
MNETTARIRVLNDELRQLHRGGRILITAGVQALDELTIRKIDHAIAGYTAFTEGDDPHGEHDFGSVVVAGETIFFKIDYYDLSLSAHSPNPADPAVTQRVMTIMLAEEY